MFFIYHHTKKIFCCVLFYKIDSLIDNKMPLNSMDGKYILAGGEDDLVQVWSMEDRKVVAWGEGHNSWVSFLIK